MAKSITEIVNDEFAGLHQEEAAAIGKLDALADDMATLPDDVFALAMAGLVKATAEKKQGATVLAIVQQVVPALLKLI
ncbi:MAG: hypothetical protein ABIH03_12340 [Pseudomonadota bacterium]